MRPCFRSLFLRSLALYVTASTIPSLLNPSLSQPSTTHPAASNVLPPPHLNVTTAIPAPNPSFLTTVMFTVLQTVRHYPDATFRLVRLSSSSGPATALEKLTVIRITFSTDYPTWKSINVDMLTTRWPVWGPPVFSRDEVTKNIGNMRLDVTMDIREAWQLMQGVGKYETFESVILYWPSMPPKASKQQPFYRFKVLEPKKVFVYVGAWTKKATETLDPGGLEI